MKFSQFPTYINLSNTLKHNLPSQYGFQDVRYTHEFAEYFINRFSEPGDTVLDPFAGFGTTLVSAKKLGRRCFGVEIDGKKIAYMREHLEIGEELKHGDIKRLFLERIFPPIDLILTSPPYMGREDTANALTGYQFAGSYESYLQELQDIMKSLASLLNNQGLIIIEISNLQQTNSRTTLAWDVGIKLSEILTFEGEIIVNWEGNRDDQTKKDGLYNYGYDHSYCLIYSNEL